MVIKMLLVLLNSMPHSLLQIYFFGLLSSAPSFPCLLISFLCDDDGAHYVSLNAITTQSTTFLCIHSDYL